MAKSPPDRERPGAQRFLPETFTLARLAEAARSCQGCPLYRSATQTVFGEGSSGARVILVGEQPGDVEDRLGRPFIGPAGKLLDKALVLAGLDRALVYVTNAVKHFTFEERGKARIHKKPRPGDIRACRPWLDAEIATLRPALIVLLGATAAQALMGPAFRVSRERGKLLAGPAGIPVLATLHPSAILRAPDSAARGALLKEFVADLEVARRELEQSRETAGAGP